VPPGSSLNWWWEVSVPSIDLETTVHLHYQDGGDGRPVVCLHSAWCSRRFFRPRLPILGAPYRLFVPDLR